MTAFSTRSTATGRRIVRRVLPLLLSGLVSTLGMPGALSAQSMTFERQESRAPYAAFVAEASRRFSIPERWILAVMRAESAGDLRAKSPKGAIGLMQIMPATWRYLRIRHRLGEDPYDPRDNILAGTAYLRELHDRYGTPGFLAAYNAGPGRYDDHLKTGRPLPADTRAYVADLTPHIGNEPLPRNLDVATADQRASARASLFFGRSEHSATADPAPSAGQFDDTPARITFRDLTAIAPLSDGLFVTRTNNNRNR